MNPASKRTFATAAAAATFAAFAGGATAQQCSVTSGPQRTALVELYTSEGCSSCPPADKQLSLIGAPSNGNVVALALHVNFWDTSAGRIRSRAPSSPSGSAS